LRGCDGGVTIFARPQLDFLYRPSETFERAVQFADAKAIANSAIAAAHVSARMAARIGRYYEASPGGEYS
jgi:hypothetical protein